MRVFIAVVLFLLLNVKAETCKVYEADYELSLLKYEKKDKSARQSYDDCNDFIDSAITYLAYCQDDMRLDKQYQLRQEMRRADKKRREAFSAAVSEYHQILGIRPKVREIYQNGGYNNGSRGSYNTNITPPRMPPVRQPQF